MVQSLKYIIVGLLSIIVIVMSMLIFKQQNQLQQNSTEVEAMLQSSLLGNTRLGIDGGVNKKELVANLVDSVIKTQKTNNKVEIKYVFLDSTGKKTTVEEKIDSVQFIIHTYRPNKTQPATTAVRRISLDYISKRTDGSSELTEQFYFGVFDEATQEVTFNIANLGKLGTISFTKDNPNAKVEIINVDYADGTVTVKLSGGTPFERVTEQGGKYVAYKYVDKQPKAYYSDSEGYTGFLNKVVESGMYLPFDEKFVSEYYQQNYKDSEGYVGILNREANHYLGHYSPEQRRYITGESDAEYADYEGFTGKLEPYEEIVSFPDGTLFKTITDHSSAIYSDKEGFVGNLSERISGLDSKTVVKPVVYSDEYDINAILEKTEFEDNDSEGRIGTLYRNGNVIFVPNGKTVSNYKKRITEMSSGINDNKPTDKPTYSGEWKANKVYTANKITGLVTSDSEGDVDDVYIASTKTSKDDFEKVGGTLSSSATNLESFLKSSEGQGLKATDSTRVSEVYIVEWGWNRNVGELTTTYSGVISKPKYTYYGEAYKLPSGTNISDLVTETRYRGYVTKPMEDTRIFNYSGKVARPETDTRKYSYAGTVSAVLSNNQETTKGYEYVINVKYTRYEDLTQEEKDKVDDEIGK